MKRFSLLAVLLVCLTVSLIFNGYLHYELTRSREYHSPTFFSFVFGTTQQKIVNRTLYLNLTFNVIGENLTVKAEVNGGEYSSDAVLALQFDSDDNGTIDIRQGIDEYGEYYVYFYRIDDLQFLLEANNLTLPSVDIFWGWYANGTIYLARSPPLKGWAELESPFHFCTYENGVYTFFFTFPTKPKVELFSDDGPYGIQGKLVRVLFGIAPTPRETWHTPPEGMAVYVPSFRFME